MVVFAAENLVARGRRAVGEVVRAGAYRHVQDGASEAVATLRPSRLRQLGYARKRVLSFIEEGDRLFCGVAADDAPQGAVVLERCRRCGGLVPCGERGSPEELAEEASRVPERVQRWQLLMKCGQ